MVIFLIVRSDQEKNIILRALCVFAVQNITLCAFAPHIHFT